MRLGDPARACGVAARAVSTLTAFAALTASVSCGSKDQLDGPPVHVPSRSVAASDDPSLPPGYAASSSSSASGASPSVVANASTDGGLAIPGPTALACAKDDDCITHRCNVAYGRCAFPCASDNDCVAGNYCYQSVVSACMPKEAH